MKYNGMKLKEFTSDKLVVFDPPKRMLVWDTATDTPRVMDIVAYLPKCDYPVRSKNAVWNHCAEIPEVTNEQENR